MQALMCKVSQSARGYANNFAGQTVRVTEIERTCGLNCGFLTTCILEDGTTMRGFISDEFLPIDTSMVPPTHTTCQVLINAWVFVEARNDAWNRDQEPPKDLAKFRDDYGTDWKDIRVFDVKRRGYK